MHYLSLCLWVALLCVPMASASMKDTAARARRGDPAAIRAMGDMYFQGIAGLPLDRAHGIRCWKEAANKGDKIAYMRLADHYVQSDVNKGVRYYKKAADLGSSKAIARLRELGVKYPEGSSSAASEASKENKKTDEAKALAESLDNLKIDAINFEETDLETALDYLRSRSSQTGQYINFIYQPHSDSGRETAPSDDEEDNDDDLTEPAERIVYPVIPVLKMQKTNAHKVLKSIAALTGCKIEITDYAVILRQISPPTSQQRPQVVEHTSGEVDVSSARPSEPSLDQLNEQLHTAVLKDDSAAVKKLLSQGASPDYKVQGKWPLLTVAVNAASDAGVPTLSLGILLDASPDLNARDAAGGTPLLAAARKDDLAGGIFSLLVDKGADKNARVSGSGATALILGVEKGNIGVISALVRERDLLNAADHNGMTALMLAVGKRYDEPAKLLLHSKGIQVNAKDNRGRTALMYAISVGHLEMVRLLLSNGAAIDVTDMDGATALHYAVYSHYPDIVKELLSKGADINAKTKFNMTPLDMAVSKNDDVMESLLKLAGAKSAGQQ